jgi:hypothetical protein
MIMSGSPVRLQDGRFGNLIDAWVYTADGQPIQLDTGEVVLSQDYEYAPDVNLAPRTGPGPATDMFSAEVAHGISWLNANVTDWRTRVNWADLDMYRCDQDIIGQLSIDTDEFSRKQMVRLGWYLSVEQIDAHWPPPNGVSDGGYSRSVYYGAMELVAYNHLTRAWFHRGRVVTA